MKKIINLIAVATLTASTTTSVVACHTNNKTNNIDNIKKATLTELNKYNPTNKNYIAVPTQQGVALNWNSDVKKAIYNDLASNIKDFKDYISLDDISLTNKLDPINYQNDKPETVGININHLSINTKIQVGTDLLNNIDKFINSKFDDTNPDSLKSGDLKTRSLFTENFYNNLPKAGQEWLDNTSLDQFLQLFLDPTNKNGFAQFIPTQIPNRNNNGEYDNSAASKAYQTFMDKIAKYLLDNLNYNINNTIDISSITKSIKIASITLDSKTSIYRLLDALAPDIVHFHNFLLKQMDTLKITHLTTSSFMSLLIKYLCDDIKDYELNTNDNFFQVDQADKETCHLNNNFDVLTYDLFDNWYMGNVKPDYALKPGQTLSLGVVNNNSNTLAIDKRGIQQTLKAKVVGLNVSSINIGYPTLNLFFGKGYFDGIFKSLLSSLLNPSYTPESELTVELNIPVGKIVGFTNITIPIAVGVPFAPIHTQELLQSLSDDFNLPKNEINVNISQGKFTLKYSDDPNQIIWKTATGLNIEQFIKILKNDNITGFKLVMSHINADINLNLKDGSKMTINKKDFTFQVII